MMALSPPPLLSKRPSPSGVGNQNQSCQVLALFVRKRALQVPRESNSRVRCDARPKTGANRNKDEEGKLGENFVEQVSFELRFERNFN